MLEQQFGHSLLGLAVLSAHEPVRVDLNQSGCATLDDLARGIGKAARERRLAGAGRSDEHREPVDRARLERHESSHAPGQQRVVKQAILAILRNDDRIPVTGVSRIGHENVGGDVFSDVHRVNRFVSAIQGCTNRDAISTAFSKSGDTGRVDVGEVLLIDDVVTGWDDNKPARPCMVVRVSDPPRSGAWVVPRSTKGRQGTFVPAGALPGLNKDGRFMFLPHFVPAVDLADCESLGVLGDADRERVLANVNEVEIDP
jgi:hypothetical protein